MKSLLKKHGELTMDDLLKINGGYGGSSGGGSGRGYSGSSSGGGSSSKGGSCVSGRGYVSVGYSSSSGSGSNHFSYSSSSSGSSGKNFLGYIEFSGGCCRAPVASPVLGHVSKLESLNKSLL